MTETNDEESLIQEIVPMVKVDPIEVPLPIHSKPQPSEQDIWWILNKRKRYMYENKGNIRNKIHFYGVVNESLEMLLNDFSVVVHKYSAPKSHSIKAWRKLYTEMLQDLKNNL